MPPRVLLTGCCGYIGAWITVELLRAGFRVRGTSREPEYARKLFAEALDDEQRSRFELIHTELLDAGTWQGAADDCAIVIHTACPVVTEPGTAQSQMLDPALLGTENVVREAARAGGVTRFLHMSSVVTLFDHHRPATRAMGDERVGPGDWNETASAHIDPYAHAKVRGERRARELVAELLPGALFASILPGPVIGPPVAGKRVPASVDKTLSPLLGGQLKLGSVDLWLGVVDVRDVAAAFVAAARVTIPENARYVCVAQPVPRIQDLADVIRDAFPEYAAVLPRRALPLPRWLLLAAMRLTVTREAYSYTRAMLGRRIAFDTSNTERELDISWRPVRESLIDTVAWLHRCAEPLPAGDSRH